MRAAPSPSSTGRRRARRRARGWYWSRYLWRRRARGDILDVPRQLGSHTYPAGDALRARMRGVLELPEQPGDHERHLLADVDGVVADPLDRPGREQHRHRPLAPVGVVADLESQPEAVAIQVVDYVVLPDQILGHRGVALEERPLRL